MCSQNPTHNIIDNTIVCSLLIKLKLPVLGSKVQINNVHPSLLWLHTYCKWPVQNHILISDLHNNKATSKTCTFFSWKYPQDWVSLVLRWPINPFHKKCIDFSSLSLSPSLSFCLWVSQSCNCESNIYTKLGNAKYCQSTYEAPPENIKCIVGHLSVKQKGARSLHLDKLSDQKLAH